MARPKKSKEERLTERVKFDLTRTDYAKALQSAEAAGMTLTAYARQQFLAGRVIIKQTREIDHTVYDQFRRLGILLNQLTKTSNITGKISPEIVQLSERIERFLIQNIDDF